MPTVQWMSRARSATARTPANRRHARTDGEEVAHALRARGVEHAVELGGEIGKIEMAMAVDKHGPNLSDWRAEFKRL